MQTELNFYIDDLRLCFDSKWAWHMSRQMTNCKGGSVGIFIPEQISITGQ